MEFQARPFIKYKDLYKKASLSQLEEFHNQVIKPLENYAHALEKKVLALNNQMQNITHKEALEELSDALLITTLRAKHKSNTLRAIYQHRMSNLKQVKNTTNPLLKADSIRNKALEIVNKREGKYRYSTDLIARKLKGKTAYNFGYLYPVSNLHFWKREENQIKNNRWGPLYQNIWNIPKIIGLMD